MKSWNGYGDVYLVPCSICQYKGVVMPPLMQLDNKKGLVKRVEGDWGRGGIFRPSRQACPIPGDMSIRHSAQD